MINRTHKGERIKPANHLPSFTPWVGTEDVVTVVIDGKVWLAVSSEPGATVQTLAAVGICSTYAHGKVHDIWRLPLSDWDELVRQVERLRREGT